MKPQNQNKVCFIHLVAQQFPSANIYLRIDLRMTFCTFYEFVFMLNAVEHP